MQSLSEYLLPRRKRAVLGVLFEESFAGSVTDLAEKADLNRRDVRAEVEILAGLGVVEMRKDGNAKRVVVNRKNPNTKLLLALFATNATNYPRLQKARANLSQYGGLLVFTVEPDRPLVPLEQAVVDALRVCHDDPAMFETVAPVLWLNRDKVNLAKLVQLAELHECKRRLGLAMDLTTELSGERKFAEAATALHDKRYSKVENLFSPDGKFHLDTGLELAKRRTPPVAYRWNYMMNLDLEDMQSMFRKATRHARL